MIVRLNDFSKEVKKRKTEYNTAINSLLESGTYILGNQVSEFENEFSHYLGTSYCIGVANGLEALQISLMICGVGQEDEVITTPLSAVATTLAILAVGAKPVFVDTDENGQLDTSLIENKINKKTKAVLPVDLYGMSCDLKELKKLCQKYDLFLVEDAAQAHGSIFKDKKLGTFGDTGCFSFYPTKNLGAFGDGGAIVTSDKKLATLAYRIRDYGQKSKYIHTTYGLNSRLDEIQAAILRIKLKHLDKDNEKRQQVAKVYSNELGKINDIKIINYDKMEFSNHHLFVIRRQNRDKLKSFLEKKGIQTAIHYPFLITEQKFLKNLKKRKDYPIAKKITKEALTLPCHPNMEPKEAVYVCKNIKEYYKSP